MEGKISAFLEAPGVKIRFILDRSRAPLTVAALFRLLPTEGRVYWFKDIALYLPLNLRLAAEKPVSSLEAGEVFYWPFNGSIGFAAKGSEFGFRIDKIGFLEDQPSALKVLKNGTKVRIKVVEDRTG